MTSGALSGRPAIIWSLDAPQVHAPQDPTELIAEEALAGAVRRLCRGGSWQGLARELAWRAVTAGHRDPRSVEALSDSAEAMLATLVDAALWEVEHRAIETRDEFLEDQPGELGAALTAARLDAGEEAERLVAAAYERVLESLLSGTRRAA